jgi:hypothetical protein
MKKVFLLFLLLRLYTPSVIEGQTALSSSDKELLWQKFQKDLLPLPFHKPICLLDALKESSPTQRNVPFWLDEVAKMRQAGAYECCFQMLAVLQPSATTPQYQGLWLSEKITLLLVMDKLD